MAHDIDYVRLSTVELIECIVQHKDRDALKHFLEKRKIIYHEKRWFLLPEYILYLCNNRIPWHFYPKRYVDNEEFEQQVNYLTIRRFITLDPTDKTQDTSEKSSSSYLYKYYTDCRKYYRYVLERIPLCSLSLRAERETGEVFRDLIYQNFWYSVLEAKRAANPHQVRYNWIVNGGLIILYHPIWLTGREFRTWLEKHIDSPDSHRPGERQRIQQIVDEKLGSVRYDSIDNLEEEADKYPAIYNSPDYLESLIESDSVENRVAKKKVLEIDQLRPAIRSLGKIRVHELVVRILEDVENNCYSSTNIINEFGISKATASRFAGTRWKKSKENGQEMIIPDLWRNVAEVVMSDSDFIEAAVAVGVNNVIDIVMKGSGNKGISDE